MLKQILIVAALPMIGAAGYAKAADLPSIKRFAIMSMQPVEPYCREWRLLPWEQRQCTLGPQAGNGAGTPTATISTPATQPSKPPGGSDDCDKGDKGHGRGHHGGDGGHSGDHNHDGHDGAHGKDGGDHGSPHHGGDHGNRGGDHGCNGGDGHGHDGHGSTRLVKSRLLAEISTRPAARRRVWSPQRP